MAKELGGRRIPRSGGLAWSKWDKRTAEGDLATAQFHFEHKGTVKKSLSIKRDWLDKVRAGAMRCSKDPGLIVTFEGSDQRLDEWVMVPMDVFKRLMDDASDALHDGSDS